MNAQHTASFVFSAAALLLSALASAAPGDTTLISARDPDLPLKSASGSSGTPALSATGRFVVFSSSAGNLVANDTNRRQDVFVFDRQSGAIQRVSVGLDGAEGNSDSADPSISADGRYVVFTSNASNLVPDDTNDGTDIFRYDRQTHSTTRISVNSSGEQATRPPIFDPFPRSVASADAQISANGLFVVFTSNATNLVPGDFDPPQNEVYVRDIANGLTSIISTYTAGLPGDDFSSDPVISADGRYVAFASAATNLVANDSNEAQDIFVRDRQAGTTKRVSVSSSGEQAAGGDVPFSSNPSISSDGRLVTYTSQATNLVANDTNDVADVFLYNQQNASTTRVSVSSQGAQANNRNDIAFLSADGRYVLFSSIASNLIANDTNDRGDLFLRNLSNNTTVRVSVRSNGAQATGDTSLGVLSADNRYIAYVTFASDIVSGDRNNNSDVFLRPTSSATTQLVSAAKQASQTAPGDSEAAREHGVSGDGSTVVFRSDASILVENDTNDRGDIFARNVGAAQTSLVTTTASGGLADGSSFDSAISATGRYVTYQSFAGNLVDGDTNETSDIFLHDRQTGSVSRVNIGPNGEQTDPFSSSGSPTVSSNGRFVAFNAGDELIPGGSFADVYVRDTQQATLTRASADGEYGLNPSMSNTGRYVAFEQAQNIYVWDRETGSRQLVSVNDAGQPGDSAGNTPSISSDGRYVAFQSSATNLAPGNEVGNSHIFVRDRAAGKTTMVSVDSFGVPANDVAFDPAISGNGRFVAFYSSADNLVANDTNHAYDVFVHDRVTGVTTRESVGSSGAEGNGDSVLPSLSADGLKVVFSSAASNLVSGDFNENTDVFRHERRAVTVIRVNAGGGGVTDSRGHFWQGDRGFNSGSSSTYPNQISNTNDDALYQSERWDAKSAPELQYNFDVPNGTYIVRLHFAENYAPNFGRMRRVFDVDMQGVSTFPNLDVYSEAGAQTALIKTATVEVTNGRLNVTFRHRINNPFVDAIEVISQ